MAIRNNPLLTLLSFLFLVFVIAVLAFITQTQEATDPCAGQQSDISAAVLAQNEGDEDALVNRAIIMRQKCKKEAP